MTPHLLMHHGKPRSLPKKNLALAALRFPWLPTNRFRLTLVTLVRLPHPSADPPSHNLMLWLIILCRVNPNPAPQPREASAALLMYPRTRSYCHFGSDQQPSAHRPLARSGVPAREQMVLELSLATEFSM